MEKLQRFLEQCSPLVEIRMLTLLCEGLFVVLDDPTKYSGYNDFWASDITGITHLIVAIAGLFALYKKELKLWKAVIPLVFGLFIADAYLFSVSGRPLAKIVYSMLAVVTLLEILGFYKYAPKNTK